MIGCYDFCAHYDWTFRWIRNSGGKTLLLRYWDEAIRKDSQLHAAELIHAKGFEGMVEYWGDTLAEEAPAGGYHTQRAENSFWIEMTDCPSRGFLVRNGVEFSGDYCDHCIGWIGPLMEDAGFVIDHDHNHQGQCWWEFKKKERAGEALPDHFDIREKLTRSWEKAGHPIHQFRDANHPDQKQNSG